MQCYRQVDVRGDSSDFRFDADWLGYTTMSDDPGGQHHYSCVLCNVISQNGVGDSPDSFAYDGYRVVKWNGPASKYGEVRFYIQ